MCVRVCLFFLRKKKLTLKKNPRVCFLFDKKESCGKVKLDTEMDVPAEVGEFLIQVGKSDGVSVVREKEIGNKLAKYQLLVSATIKNNTSVNEVVFGIVNTTGVVSEPLRNMRERVVLYMVPKDLSVGNAAIELTTTIFGAEEFGFTCLVDYAGEYIDPKVKIGEIFGYETLVSLFLTQRPYNMKLLPSYRYQLKLFHVNGKMYKITEILAQENAFDKKIVSMGKMLYYHIRNLGIKEERLPIVIGAEVKELIIVIVNIRNPIVDFEGSAIELDGNFCGDYKITIEYMGPYSPFGSIQLTSKVIDGMKIKLTKVKSVNKKVKESGDVTKFVIRVAVDQLLSDSPRDIRLSYIKSIDWENYEKNPPREEEEKKMEEIGIISEIGQESGNISEIAQESEAVNENEELKQELVVKEIGIIHESVTPIKTTLTSTIACCEVAYWCLSYGKFSGKLKVTADLIQGNVESIGQILLKTKFVGKKGFLCPVLNNFDQIGRYKIFKEVQRIRCGNGDIYGCIRYGNQNTLTIVVQGNNFKRPILLGRIIVDGKDIYFGYAPRLGTIKVSFNFKDIDCITCPALVVTITSTKARGKDLDVSAASQLATDLVKLYK